MQLPHIAILHYIIIIISNWSQERQRQGLIKPISVSYVGIAIYNQNDDYKNCLI